MANPKKNKTKTFLNKKSKNQEWNPNRKKSEDTKIRKKMPLTQFLQNCAQENGQPQKTF